jgi:hypothetical protein
MALQEELLEDVKTFLSEQALKHFDKIEDYVKVEAAKTDTPWDDILAEQLLSWARGRLQDFVK